MSDDVVLLEDEAEYSLTEATYNGRCPDCYDPDAGEYARGGNLSFVMDPDPDSPSYTAECPGCDGEFVLRPTQYQVSRYEPEI